MAPADFGRGIDAYQNWLCDVGGSYHYSGGGGGGASIDGAAGWDRDASSSRMNGVRWNGLGYVDRLTGDAVSYNEVYHNYIAPNSLVSLSGNVAQEFVAIFNYSAAISKPSSGMTASLNGNETKVPALSDIFSSLKMLLPVAFLLEGNLSWESLVATQEAAGVGFILRGIDPGHKFYYISGGVGGGLFGVQGCINQAYFFYSGDASHFNEKMFEGDSWVLSFSAPAEGPGFGRSIILMPVIIGNQTNYLIGFGTSIGAGASLIPAGSGQFNIMHTHILP